MSLPAPHSISINGPLGHRRRADRRRNVRLVDAALQRILDLGQVRLIERRRQRGVAQAEPQLGQACGVGIAADRRRVAALLARGIHAVDRQQRVVLVLGRRGDVHDGRAVVRHEARGWESRAARSTRARAAPGASACARPRARSRRPPPRSAVSVRLPSRIVAEPEQHVRAVLHGDALHDVERVALGRKAHRRQIARAAALQLDHDLGVVVVADRHARHDRHRAVQHGQLRASAAARACPCSR